jgi:ribose transport system permease protein
MAMERPQLTLAHTIARLQTALNNPKRRWLLRGEFLVAILILLFVAVVAPMASGMLTERNALNVLSNFWPLAIIVIGQMFVLIVAGIDLSQTAIINITNTFGAVLLVQTLAPAVFERTVFWGSLLGESGGILSDTGMVGVVATVFVMLLIGAAFGALNGLAVAKLGMPPFMVTLGMLLMLRGTAIWMTRSENLAPLPPEYLAIGSQVIWGVVSIPLILCVLVAVTAHWILSRTKLGLWLYATGSNQKVASVSGVPRDRVLVIAYTLSGTLATLGGILYSTRLQAGRPTLADDFLLDIIGAAVIGGISLFGGRGTVGGALLGAMFFVVLSNGLTLLNLPFTTVFIVKGLVIILAALLDVGRNKLIGGKT